MVNPQQIYVGRMSEQRNAPKVLSLSALFCLETRTSPEGAATLFLSSAMSAEARIFMENSKGNDNCQAHKSANAHHPGEAPCSW